MVLISKIGKDVTKKGKRELTGRIIEAERVAISIGKPDPNCPKCHGAGVVDGLYCVCTMSFEKPKKTKLAVLTEKTKEGGVQANFEEIGSEQNQATTKYLKDLKKDMRYHFRWASLNMYGKKVKDLDRNELKLVLEDTYNSFTKFYVKSVGKKEFKDVFRETFNNEIKKLK